MAASALGEDIEDQARAVQHAATELPLQIALLRRRKRMVHQHQIGPFSYHGFTQFPHLAAPKEGAGMDTAPVRGDNAADSGARRLCKSAELRGLVVSAIWGNAQGDQQRAFGRARVPAEGFRRITRFQGTYRRLRRFPAAA